MSADEIWEPDLWGRVRLSVENAVSNAQTSAADLENLRLSQQALLATDYFSLAADDMQQAVLHDTIEAYERNLQLTTDRFNGGVASRTDVTLAQSQLAGARAQSAELRVARAQFEHAIATLTGQSPAALEIGVSRIAGPPPPIPVGVPSELLERRPDIAASERQLAAANANVGIAETAYYPTLTLSANPGLLATSLASLFSYASRSWSGSASLPQTAADFGRRRAQLESARAVYDATVAATVDRALRVSGSRGRAVEPAFPRGRGSGATGSRHRRSAVVESRERSLQGGDRFVLERHHHPGHCIERPADRHCRPAAAGHCGCRSREGSGRRLGRVELTFRGDSSREHARRSPLRQQSLVREPVRQRNVWETNPPSSDQVG